MKYDLRLKELNPIGETDNTRVPSLTLVPAAAVRFHGHGLSSLSRTLGVAVGDLEYSNGSGVSFMIMISSNNVLSIPSS